MFRLQLARASECLQRVASLTIAAAAMTQLLCASAAAEPAADPPAATGKASGAIPKPQLSEAEAELTARLDKAIAPALAIAVSAEDAASLKDAFKAIGAAKPEEALAFRAKLKDPVAGKLIDWYRLKNGLGEAAEYRAFLDANSDWPERTLLQQRLEEALFTKGGAATAIKAEFAEKPPQTGIGLAALASAHLVEGDAASAKTLAVKAWREFDIPATLETGFLDRFGKLIGPADHKWRLDRLLIDDLRWKGARAERAKTARRVIARLPAGEKKKAQARLAVFLQAAGAKKLIDAIAAEKDPDWGLVFHHAQAQRRGGKIEEAAKLVLGAPTEAAKIVNPDGWWGERRAIAYAALRGGKAKLAYEIVREAGPLSVNPLKEQTFMAGWLALRHLQDPALAEPHFTAMAKAADGPLSRAKANYWLGRTAEARRDKAAAEEHYRRASEDADTFHGLLARQTLEPGRQSIEVKPPQEPSVSEIEAFNALDPVRALIVAHKAGLPRYITRLFIVNLRNAVTSEAGTTLVAHLAEAIGDTQMAVRTGKAALARRQNLLYYAYPVHPFPSYTPLREPPETAFLLGIARQETEFNTTIVSGAGAKGLLQVMTVTAKHVCRDYKIKCDIPRLLTDPPYNAMIGSAYIADRMAEFSGSYVLGLAGYNAGPGRARQWIREFGDPRDPAVDPIDWIERIPIQETREYVGKVLANVQMYRARLGEASALRLAEDLNRARPSGRKAESADGPPGGDKTAESVD